MKCKYCKNEIPDNSIFCMWCGERIIRERKKKDEIKVPKPRQLASGKWNIELRAEGQSITEDTAELCELKAKAIRAEFVEKKKALPKLSLGSAIDKYIAERSNILSPSTIRGYNAIRTGRFQSVMDKDIGGITNWQSIINAETELVSPKTLRNSWAFIKTVLQTNGVEVPNVTLPQIVKKELAWLDYSQISKFIAAIYGKPAEIAALLALHSLRRSEVLALTPAKVKDGIIYVEGSAVFDKNNKLTYKDTNKNTTSRRQIPIMIPRLQELIDNYNGDVDKPFIRCYPNMLWEQINRVCEENGLPRVGMHGLRRSFASLAHHLGWSEHSVMAAGGWADYKTVHNIYTKLAEKDAAKDAKKMTRFYKKITNENTNASKKH